ncbi:MAG: undecaprenyl/decaprenyl-phosphate alpha-N-acetylglucosaminyl 1-phosphate transferase, partial [Pseudomonadota bacterium]
LRVFTIRMAKGLSPFKADRNHLHHILLDLGLSHIRATTILALFNIYIIVFAFQCQRMKGQLLLLAILFQCFLFSRALTILRKRKLAK